VKVLDDIAVYWRVPWAAGTFVVGIPILIAWHAWEGVLSPSDLTLLPAIWLAWAALLRWHFVVKRRRRLRR
jgi:hypothetical protein